MSEELEEFVVVFTDAAIDEAKSWSNTIVDRG